MNFWAKKNISLIVSGGIAAYRACDLIRTFRREGASVSVVATKSALEFVTELSLQALSGELVNSDLFNPILADGMDHIHQTKNSDILIIAPATANLIAKMATGIADDLASTTILAYDGPKLVAPAMNSRMWQNPATQRNVAQLKKDGVQFIDPNSGALACGEEGEGRLAPIEDIVEAAQSLLTPKILAGHRLLITAGPTHEAIDPVRFISNHSTGKMGLSICKAALYAGAQVVLIHGPLKNDPPQGVELQPATSAQEMYDKSMAAWANGCTGAILTAAVGDYRPVTQETQKIKKNKDNKQLTLELTVNPDILATLAAKKDGRVVVGFAAETGEALKRGREKIKRKNCDLLVINDLLDAHSGFGVDTNQVTVLYNSGKEEPWPLLSKDMVAAKLIQTIATLLNTNKNNG
ncbi:MAG: bifunctional phosphopantothenoylcysteine decarboxylase/phosphopantothenate--cysteine ligase CoaBC [Magnetococcales bacterium]|nr:bifunctional phosphopantothenoylcysteine decarboxylase/phosphopantothenate--cysteine ligase CoaBC [Magnetococcales bacterium]